MKYANLWNERGDVIFRDNESTHESGLSRYLKGAGTAFLGAYLAACGGDSGTGPNPIPSGTPTPSGKVTVSGAISGRMSGEPINGCEVTYTGKSGQGVAKAVAVNGNYEIRDLPVGMYEVKIENCGNVTHTNQNFNVAGPNAPFSVIRWNSVKDGVMYDAKFDAFFNAFARNEGNPSTQRGVDKWDVNRNPPREFYISLTAPSQFYQNWNPEAAEEFKNLLEEINAESVSDMSCGRATPPSISNGSSVGIYKPASVIFAIRPDATQFNDQHRVNGYLDGGVVSLSALDFNNPENYRNSKRSELKGVLTHEIGHVYGGFHAFDSAFKDTSIMGINYRKKGSSGLSKEDKLAFCIIYHDDTHSGNLSPDTNPR